MQNSVSRHIGVFPSLEAHFESIVQNSHDAIVSKDVHGIVQSWNRAAENMFGWAAAEILGQSIRTIIPADRLHEEDSILARIRAGEIVGKFETLRKHKDGHLVPVAVTVSPLKDASGNVIGASKIAHDISYAVEMRSKLENSELQFRTLANSIPQLAWIADGDGYIFWYNDRWYDYTGTSLEDMRGWGWTRIHHPDHVDRVKTRIQQSWDTGEEWEDLFPLRGKNGEYRWFLSRAKPLHDADGKIWRWFGTNTDVTIQRQHEQKIELLMRELNHRAKNMISVVQALVNRTVDKKYAENLAKRLLALSRNQDLLTQQGWEGAPLGDLIKSQLATIGDAVGSRVTVEGDLDFMVNPTAAETIGLAIHELSTNAIKHGAISATDGTITIACSADRGGNGLLCISWEERNGPPVSAPNGQGFGTVMIDRNPRLALGAEIDFGFPVAGFYWTFKAPLSAVRMEK